MTAERFCAGKVYRPETLRWWKWRIGGERRNAESPAFVEVSASALPLAVSTSPPPLEVVVDASVRVVVPSGFDPESLRRVLGLLTER